MDEIKAKVILPFITPVLSVELPYEETFRTSLINECLKHRNESESINTLDAHRQVGWQSKKILFSTKDPCLKKVSEFILNSLETMSKYTANNIDMKNYQIAREGWININQKGSLHFPHTHGGSTFSGVFYVKVPTIKEIDDKGINKPGFIEFLDPRNDVTTYAYGVKEFVESMTFQQQMLMQPKEGTLLVFPAWLKHWVYPNIENDERISISFNAVLVKKN